MAREIRPAFPEFRAVEGVHGEGTGFATAAQHVQDDPVRGVAGVLGAVPHHFVETTINAAEPALDFYWHVLDFVQDCVNQGGISNVLMIQPPGRDESA